MPGWLAAVRDKNTLSARAPINRAPAPLEADPAEDEHHDDGGHQYDGNAEHYA